MHITLILTLCILAKFEILLTSAQLINKVFGQGLQQDRENRSCSNFNSNMKEKTKYFPSEVMTLTCGCNKSPTPDAVPVACPDLVIIKDLEKLNILENVTLNTSTRCLSTIKLKVKLESFKDSERFLVVATCSVDAVPARETKAGVFTFQKVSDQEECKHAVDCVTKGQQCLLSGNKKTVCSCPKDRPIYNDLSVAGECLAGRYLEEPCDINEECKNKEPNSYCNSEFCDCPYPYKISGNQCVKGGDASQIIVENSLLVALLPIAFFRSFL